MNMYIKLFYWFLFLGCSTELSAQNVDTTIVYNQFNSQGKKEGYWKRTMQNSNETYLYAIECFKDNRLNGLCTYFYPNRNKRSEQWYKNDTLEGLSKFYRENGTIYIIEPFIKGRTNGIKQYYNYESKLISEDEYKDGVINGVERSYYASGNLETESTLINNIEEGIRKIFSDDVKHEILREFDFRNGVRIASRYYKNGKLVKEEKFNYDDQLKKDRELKKKNGVD